MENVNGLRKGFVLDPQGNRLLPITHVNLVIGNNGETLSGTLERITETVSILQENGGVISVETKTELDNLNTANIRKGAICYVSTEDKYYSYSANGSWKPMQTSSSGGSDDGYSHIWVGPDPPANENMLWLDTNSDGVIEDETDLELLYSLRELVSELQTTITVLDKRVSDLEKNGVIIVPPTDPDDPGTEEGTDLFFLLEDGSSLLLEDGTGLLLETKGTSSSVQENGLLFEDGTQILLEDGTELLLEKQGTTPSPIKEDALLFEDGAEILLEDGSKLLLESASNDAITVSYVSSEKKLEMTGNNANLFVSNQALNIIDSNSIVSSSNLIIA